MSHRQYAIKPTNIDKLNARLLSVSLSKDEKDWQSVFHTHHFTELFFVVNGEGNFLFHDEKYHIRTGDLVIIPHTWNTRSSLSRAPHWSTMSSEWRHLLPAGKQKNLRTGLL